VSSTETAQEAQALRAYITCNELMNTVRGSLQRCRSSAKGGRPGPLRNAGYPSRACVSSSAHHGSRRMQRALLAEGLSGALGKAGWLVRNS